jgi:hypothetical protein
MGDNLAHPGLYRRADPAEADERDGVPACAGCGQAMSRITPGIQIFVLVGIATAVTLYYRPVQGLSWLDGIFFVLWLALLGWCFVPRNPALDADGHESAGQRFSFRMGKALKQILHLGRRDPTIRD